MEKREVRSRDMYQSFISRGRMAGDGRGNEKTSLQLEIDFMMRRRKGGTEEDERIKNAPNVVRRGWRSG